jgi:hypothetical protein
MTPEDNRIYKTKDDQPMNIYQRIHAIMGEVEYIQKEKKDGMKYSVVSHDTVTGKVRPFFVKHGVIYYPFKVSRGQDGNKTMVDMVVRFASVDDKTDFLDVETCGYGDDHQDKGPGKAMSYAVKYAILKLLGLETGDDPDDVHAEKAAEKRATKEQRANQTMLVNKINQCMDTGELESVFDEFKAEYDDLPDMFRDFVDTSYEMREAQIKNGTAKIVGEAFNSVEESRKRAAELLADMDRCVTRKDMDQWSARWLPTVENLKGQSKGGKDSDVFKDRMAAKLGKIIDAEQSLNNMKAG